MRRFPKLRPNRWDALLAAAVAGCALLTGFLTWGQTDSGDSLTAVVSADGQELAEIPLTASGERTVQNRGYTLHLRWTEEAVWVEEADCPTQDCVHTGHISRAGQSILCLPARVSISLTGGSTDNGMDVMIG